MPGRWPGARSEHDHGCGRALRFPQASSAGGGGRRYYQPDLGRFAAMDPTGKWFDGVNLGNSYAYLASRYRNGFDPVGLESNDKCQRGESNASVLRIRPNGTLLTRTRQAGRRGGG